MYIYVFTYVCITRRWSAWQPARGARRVGPARYIYMYIYIYIYIYIYMYICVSTSTSISLSISYLYL